MTHRHPCAIFVSGVECLLYGIAAILFALGLLAWRVVRWPFVDSPAWLSRCPRVPGVDNPLIRNGPAGEEALYGTTLGGSK